MKNASKYILSLASAASLLLLSACSQGFSANTYNFDVEIDPNPINFGVTVDPETGVVTYTLGTQTLSFASKAGAVGATIEGYDIEYYEASDNPAFPGDSIMRSSGSLSVYVPPGIVCDELVANAAWDYCSSNSEGARFARGPERTSPPTYLVPPDIAREIFRLVGIGGAVGAYADIYFYGTDDLQRPFRIEEPYQMAISITGGE